MIDGFAHFQLVVSNMICDCSPMTMEKPIVEPSDGFKRKNLAPRKKKPNKYPQQQHLLLLLYIYIYERVNNCLLE